MGFIITYSINEPPNPIRWDTYDQNVWKIDQSKEVSKNKEYEKAMEKDLKHYQEIMHEINPRFDEDFKIIERPKTAQHFRDIRDSYTESMESSWKANGEDVGRQIILEIEKEVARDPLSTEFYISNIWGEGFAPYGKLIRQEKEYCREYLERQGFELGDVVGLIVTW